MIKKNLTIALAIIMVIGLSPQFFSYGDVITKNSSKSGQADRKVSLKNENFEMISIDLTDRLEKEVHKKIVDSYSEHYDIKDITVKVLSKKLDKRTNDIDVLVTFNIKSKYNAFYEYPVIAGAAKRLGIDLSVGKKELILEQILKNNRGFTEKQARSVLDVLMANKSDMENSSKEYDECNVDLKLIINEDAIEFLANRGDGVYVDAAEVFPQSYETLFKQGYNSVIAESKINRVPDYGVAHTNDRLKISYSNFADAYYIIK